MTIIFVHGVLKIDVTISREKERCVRFATFGHVEYAAKVLRYQWYGK